MAFMSRNSRNPLCKSETEQLALDKHGMTALVIATLPVVHWHAVSVGPQLVVATAAWKQLSCWIRSAGESESGMGVSKEERTEQLGRSLTDCAMLRVAVARAQKNTDVFILSRVYGLPPQIHNDPLEGGRAKSAL